MPNTIQQLIETMDLGRRATVDAAIAEALGPNFSVGQEVAVIGDPTYPFEGVKGKIESMTGGFAKVKFANGQVVPLHTNLLVAV